MQIGDVQLAFPYLLLAIAILAVVGPSLPAMIAVLGIRTWVVYARTVRASVTMNCVSSMRPVRGTASMNDMKTPISTQNSIEIATAETAVTATITASKRDADTW